MIYILEDDANIRELILYTLKNQDLEVEGFERPTDFFEAIDEQLPELVILDIMLPEMSGLEVLERLRRHGRTQDLMVMMLTAKASEYDKVVGLNQGADDYLAKPFGMMELLARIKALLRRCENRKHTHLEFGPVKLDLTKHIVTVYDKEVDLTLKEFLMLQTLMEHPGQVFTRDNLIDRIWGSDYYGDNRTVDVHIRTLRQKLGDGSKIVQTVHGVGYKVEDMHYLDGPNWESKLESKLDD